MYTGPIPKKPSSIVDSIAYPHQFTSTGSPNPLGFFRPEGVAEPVVNTPHGWSYGDREHRVPPRQYVEEDGYDGLSGLGDDLPEDFKIYRAGETIWTPWGAVTAPFDMQGPAGAEYVESMGSPEGLGQVGQQVVGTVASAGTPVAIAAITSTSLTIPIIGAAIAGVTAIIGIFMASAAKYHAQESATTKIADQTSSLMQQNLAAWNASCKTPQEQAQALANFDSLQQNMDQQCLQSQYGDPGKRCAAERDRGGKYDQYASMRDPISGDPQVGLVQAAANGTACYPAVVAPATTSILGSAGVSTSSMLPLLIAAGLIAAAFLIPDDAGGKSKPKGAKS